jgi:Short C-terminal domain
MLAIADDSSRVSGMNNFIIRQIRRNACIALCLLVIALSATGCQNPGIVQLSPDTYLLSRDDHGGMFGNKNRLKAGVIRDANAFAAKQGKVAIPISAKEHPMGILGDWAAFEYQFRVVDKNDPEALRTALVQRADVVVEKTEKISADTRIKDETPKQPDLYVELMKLDELRKKGLITDAEFETQKQKLLNHTN